MQRQIKFRAWDKIDKKMYYNAWPTPTGVDIYKDDQIPEEVTLSRGKACFVLMQFTGLLDKNGKEIFEDDLVQVKGVVWRVIWNEEHYKWTAITRNVWNKTRGSYLNKSLAYLRDRQCELVGNIYANPELLKGE